MISGSVFADLNDSLVAYYPFNGNANDESGNSNDGTVNGATLTTDRFGNENSAYSFDGVGDYISIQNSSALQQENITMQAFIYMSSFDGYYAIVRKHYGGGKASFCLGVTSENNTLHPRELYACINCGLADCGNLYSNIQIEQETWYSVACTYNGEELKLFINGELDSVEPCSYTIHYDQNNIGIGADYFENVHYLHGKIDDMYFYSRALTESEIDSLYHEGGWDLDTTPPGTPQNLTATPGNQQITLRWDLNTESDLHKYNIYCDTSSPATILIDSCVASSPPDTFYTDTGLTNGQIYYYRVTTVDNSGNESGYSDEIRSIPVFNDEYIPDANTIALWHLNEGMGNTVYDATSNKHDGIVTNPTWLAQGKYGSAIEFAPLTGRLDLPNTESLNFSNQLTIEFWVFPITTGDLIANKNGTTEINGDFQLHLQSTSIDFDWWTSDNVHIGPISTTVNLSRNKWSHVALVLDDLSDIGKIYINGLLDKEFTFSPNIVGNTKTLYAGGRIYNGSPIYSLDGYLDEIRISNIIRTDFNVDLPLAIPQNLKALSGNQKVTLRWNQNTESDLVKYRIYRDTSSPTTTLIDSCVSSSPPDTVYTDTGLTNGQIYYYRITAVDSSGNESDFSDEVSSTPYGGPVWYISTSGNDSTGNGSEILPFRTIQHGINQTTNGDTVLVYPGTYIENINFDGKNIVVGSLFLTTQDTSYISQTIIDGNQQNGISVVLFESGETNNAKLSGFTITGGTGTYRAGDFQFAEGVGGGIMCYQSSPTLSNLIITNNSSPETGGGICTWDSDAIIEWSIIKNNICDWNGGGIYAHNSKLKIINCVINDNNAISENMPNDTQGGGAIYISGSESDTTVIINCTVANNQTGGEGGGLYANNSSFKIVNSIIWQNSASLDGVFDNPNISALPFGDIVSVYSLVEGGRTGIGNIDTDPLFIDATIGNYRLTDYSPCIGTGLDTSIVPITDLDGNTRPNPAGSNPDMGAYENALAASLHNSFIHVDTTGNDSASVGLENDPFATIQAAIDYSNDGDTVLVQPGTYVENINFNGKNIVVGSLFLTTQDTSYISSTIIDGNQNGSVVKFESGENNNAKISGFTIQNGYGFQGYYYEQSGGGINCRNSSPQLIKLVIKNNSSVKYGGGIYCDDSSPRISDVKIISNTSSSCGGGICITGTLNNSSSEPIISNIEIINNTAGNDGGGMSVFHGSNPAISNVVISGNTGTHGGGIQLQDSDVTLKNVLITNNIANHPTSPYGGGIYCNGSSPTLINCTISGNEASNGGAVHCYAASNPIIINSMLWDNVPQEIFFQWESGTGQSAMTINITHSNINGGQSNIQTDGIHTVIWNDGNIDTDPLFVDATNDDYHLSNYSPCIGTGIDSIEINGTWYYAPLTDLNGNPRPNPAGSNPDMGAFENSRATPIDTIPPAIPQNLVITGYLQTITLKWNASINADLSHYNIYRANSPDFSVDSTYFKGKVFAPDTIFTDSLIQNNSIYYYKVTAVDTTGNESDPSAELVITATVVNILDITFQQRVDGTGLVNIYYSFSGHDTTHYEVIPYLSNFNDEAWGKLSQVSGDADAVLPGDSRQITWNLKSEAPEIYSNNSTVKITIGLPSKGNQYNPLNEAKIQIDRKVER